MKKRELSPEARAKMAAGGKAGGQKKVKKGFGVRPKESMVALAKRGAEARWGERNSVQKPSDKS